VLQQHLGGYALPNRQPEIVRALAGGVMVARAWRVSSPGALLQLPGVPVISKLPHMSATQLEKKAIALIKELYSPSLTLYRRAGQALLNLRRARPATYGRAELLKLARKAGVVSQDARRAPDLLYNCRQFAGDIFDMEFKLLVEHHISFEQIRLVLRALGRRKEIKAKKALLAAIRARLSAKGSTGFTAFIRRHLPPTRSRR
jgi:hypothetical protein